MTNNLSPARVWVGRVLTFLPIIVLALSARLKLSHNENVAGKWTQVTGLQRSQLISIGILELWCLGLYAIPRTRILGAATITGYVGAAIVTHVRVFERPVVPVALGIFAWIGIYLTDPRVSSLAW